MSAWPKLKRGPTKNIMGRIERAPAKKGQNGRA